MKYLRNLSFAAIIVLSCLSMACTQKTDNSWEGAKVRGSGILKALYVPAEGFAYTTEDGTLTGVTVDLLREFANFVKQSHDVDLHIEFVEVINWTDFYNQVVAAEDGVIGLGNVTITEERKSHLVFSPPYMTNIAALITHESRGQLTRIEHLDDFEGLEALAFKGTLHEKRLRELTEQYFPGVEFAFATSNDEIIDRVSEGDLYFAYIDIYNLWRAVERGRPVMRHYAGDMASEQFGYIMPLKTSWGGILEEFFESNGGFTQSDRYREIMERHLGERLAALLLDFGTE